jgi:hypothetical protein
MGLKIKIISFVVGLFFFFIIWRFIRKNSLRPSFAVLWLLVSLFLLSIPLLEPFYKWISTSVIGIVDARHIIYIFLICFLLIYVFYLTIRISKMSDQIQESITSLSILEHDIKENKDEDS